MANNNGFVDHYTVLGLPSGKEGAKLTAKDIETAYRRQAMKLHPDKRRSDDAVATSEFQLLVTSAAVLRDASSRRSFDALLLLHQTTMKVNKVEQGGAQQSNVKKEDEKKDDHGGGAQQSSKKNNAKNAKNGQNSQSRKGMPRARSGQQNSGKYYMFHNSSYANARFRYYGGETSRAGPRTHSPRSSWRYEHAENLYSRYPNFNRSSRFDHFSNFASKCYNSENESYGCPIGKGKHGAETSSNATGGYASRKRDPTSKAGERDRDSMDVEAMARQFKNHAETLKAAAETLSNFADQFIRDSVKRPNFNNPSPCKSA